MEQNNRVCPECDTPNEPEYTYCKNCGTPLPMGDGDQGNNNGGFYGNVPPPNYYGAPFVDEIDGIPTADMVRFVGSNSDKIVGKWSAMTASRSKVSWCWPVAVLMFFFDLAGAAFWFLYRRMYKVGILLLIASLLLSAVQFGAVLMPLEDFISDFVDITEDYVDTRDEAALDEAAEKLTEQTSFGSFLTALNIFSLIRWALLILLSMFSMNIYKNHAVQKIRSYGRQPNDMELLLSGGTSGGAVAVGVVVYIMISFAAGIAVVSVLMASVLGFLT